MPNITTTDALLALRPGACWSMIDDDYNQLTWSDTVQSKPTEEGRAAVV